MALDENELPPRHQGTKMFCRHDKLQRKSQIAMNLNW
jgi:hypothetical protein